MGTLQTLALLQEEEAPPPTSDRGQCPSSKLAGASPLVRDVPEPVRGLGAQGWAEKLPREETLLLLDPMGFWMQELPGSQPAQRDSAVASEQQTVEDRAYTGFGVRS